MRITCLSNKLHLPLNCNKKGIFNYKKTTLTPISVSKTKKLPILCGNYLVFITARENLSKILIKLKCPI